VYTISHNKETNILEVRNSDNSVLGKIYLNQGASLQELTIGGEAIIQDLSPLDYKDSFASSILFPFANRIKDGVYSFNNEKFQLEKNQTEEQNALHGFVYNKKFKVIEKETFGNKAKITLAYNELNKTAGFPYKYSIQVTYIFQDKTLSVKVTVKNTDSKPFPFTIGWHPYFVSDNLSKSTLEFDCDKKLILGDRNITAGIEEVKNKVALNIENKQLDDCWVLNSDKVQFKTPKYQLNFSSSVKDNFLQAYTPPRLNTIAIEPTTGVSDSFNNKIGLQTLQPNKEYRITWEININNIQRY
jgi:aldose 1-epimerase